MTGHSAARSNSEMMPSARPIASERPSALNASDVIAAPLALTCQDETGDCRAEGDAGLVLPPPRKELLMRDRRPPTADALPLAFGLHAAVASSILLLS